MKKTITALAIASLLIQQAPADEPPPGPPQEVVLEVCIVVAVGLAVGGVYIVAKKCQPQYFWLMDNEQPPKFWVGTATAKECEINEWKRIGGPYKSPSEAPPVHPPPANSASARTESQPLALTVQSSQEGLTWTAVHKENAADTEEFIYYPTNTGLFRLVGSAL